MAESFTSWLFGGKFGFQLHSLFEKGVDTECSQISAGNQIPFLLEIRTAAAVLFG